MSNLLWFDGIGWQTKVRDIGWTYVVLLLLLVCMVYVVIRIRNPKW